VLIVDDNEDVRDGFALYLRRQGYGVATAADGAEALGEMRRALPCIIVLDLAMPGMTGMGFRALQVADPDLGAIPVVVCSALGGAREIATALGSAAFLPKPVAMPDLAAAVTQHCLK
jgi:CheY-like chemotaxis protein